MADSRRDGGEHSHPARSRVVERVHHSGPDVEEVARLEPVATPLSLDFQDALEDVEGF